MRYPAGIAGSGLSLIQIVFLFILFWGFFSMFFTYAGLDLSTVFDRPPPMRGVEDIHLIPPYKWDRKLSDIHWVLSESIPAGSQPQRVAKYCGSDWPQVPYNKGYCELVEFWGGAKSGSTTLARRLKTAPDAVTAPKEVCWASKYRYLLPAFWQTFYPECWTTNSGKKIALDACPHYRYAEHAEHLACSAPGSKILWLVRDPIERLISEANDPSVQRPMFVRAADGQMVAVTELTPEVLDGYLVAPDQFHDSISNHDQMGLQCSLEVAAMLGRLLLLVPPLTAQFDLLTEHFLPSQIDFETVEEAQASLNYITGWLGGQNGTASLTHENVQRRPVRPTAAGLAAAREAWRPSVAAFFRRIGKRIPWPNFPS